MEQDAATSRTKGRVKWFDPVKGFGFVTPDDGGPDILLHVNVLRNFGRSSVGDGSTIEFEAQDTDRGRQAIAIFEITEPAANDQLLPDLPEIETNQASDLLPARVKWFDKAKGFGFANVYGRDEDVFLHIEVLRRSGLADLAPGEALAIRIVDSRRGPIASLVSAWEAAPPTSFVFATGEADLPRAVNELKELNQTLEKKHDAFASRRAERLRKLEGL